MLIISELNLGLPYLKIDDWSLQTNVIVRANNAVICGGKKSRFYLLGQVHDWVFFTTTTHIISCFAPC